MTRIKIAVVAGTALLATPAFADEPTATTAPAADATGGSESMDPATVAAAGMGTAVGAAVAVQVWPREAVDRPLIVGKGKIGVYGQYGFQRTAFVDPITMTDSNITFDGFQVGAGYGVTEKITAGLQYAFAPGLIGDGDSEVRGGLDLFGEYEVIREGKLNVTASGAFDIDLCALDAMGACGTAFGISAGLGARYGIAPKMAVFTGAPYGPGLVGDHLKISFDGPISFDVPVGFMYQATTELNVHAMTDLLTIGINDVDTTVIGADAIPLDLGALYSVTPAIDVVGTFGLPDLKGGFDKLSFVIGARWYN